MKYSENYHLYLPEGSDFVTPEQYNDNFKALDTKLKAVETAAERVVGHTHTAEEVVSGVLEAARVPYLTEPMRQVGTVLTAMVNEELQKGTVKRYTFPFSAPLEHIPKRVVLIVDHDDAGKERLYPDASYLDGKFFCIDMMRAGNDVSAFVEAAVTVKKEDAEARSVYVRRYMERIHTKDDVFYYSGSSKKENAARADRITSYGGNAFWDDHVPAEAGTSGARILLSDIGNFTYDARAVYFDLTLKQTSTGGQYNFFWVWGYIFD